MKISLRPIEMEYGEVIGYGESIIFDITLPEEQEKIFREMLREDNSNNNSFDVYIED
jgi:hypothetical protein